MSRVGAAPLWPSAQLSDAELGREDAVHALTVRPPEHLKPGQEGRDSLHFAKGCSDFNY